MTKPNNPPAFPCVIKDRYFPGNSELERLPGMTLRDYFAGQALSGIASRIGYADAESQAIDCYKIADAMLLERSKNDPQPN